MASLAPSEPSFVESYFRRAAPTDRTAPRKPGIASFRRRVDPTIPPGHPTRVLKKGARDEAAAQYSR